MQIGLTTILDTFAEAFRMRYARLVVTADDGYRLEAALRALSGDGTSVIGCDAEAGVEQYHSPDDTPDGRPGASVLSFAFSTDALAKVVPNGVGQCVMTCPTTACHNGLPANGSTGTTEIPPSPPPKGTTEIPPSPPPKGTTEAIPLRRCIKMNPSVRGRARRRQARGAAPAADRRSRRAPAQRAAARPARRRVRSARPEGADEVMLRSRSLRRPAA